MNTEAVSQKCKQIQSELGKVIVGKEEVLRKILLGVLANSHLLIEDYPGLAKTMIARSLAAATGCKFLRVQFTPDLLPADITGIYIYNQKTGDFELRKGPIFTNILLADEINRSPPKTQAALLEAMEERQTTLDGKTHRLEDPFIVLATQNPIEFEGVYQLPEAQLDRFIMKLGVGYPESRDELEILKRRIERKRDDFNVGVVVNPATVVEMQHAVEEIHVEDDVLSYITEIVRETRTHSQVEVGASPRGSLALLKLARANAAFYGRDYVLPDDVKSISVEALAHRIIPKAASWVRGFDANAIVTEILRRTPVPRVD
ncbi:MAG: MoxR family ATPase [Candidatus Bathyarchaeia archaeon]